MRMRLAALLLVAVAAFAQSPDPAWQRVAGLPAGAALRVHLRNHDVISGRLVRTTPDGLELAPRPIARTEIEKVSRRSRLRGALIGFAVTFAISAPIGAYAGPYLADWGNPSAGVRLRHGLGFGVFFGGIGAGIGALAGAHRTVYRAP